MVTNAQNNHLATLILMRGTRIRTSKNKLVCFWLNNFLNFFQNLFGLTDSQCSYTNKLIFFRVVVLVFKISGHSVLFFSLSVFFRKEEVKHESLVVVVVVVKATEKVEISCLKVLFVICYSLFVIRYSLCFIFSDCGYSHKILSTVKLRGMNFS